LWRTSRRALSKAQTGRRFTFPNACLLCGRCPEASAMGKNRPAESHARLSSIHLRRCLAPADGPAHREGLRPRHGLSAPNAARVRRSQDPRACQGHRCEAIRSGVETRTYGHEDARSEPVCTSSGSVANELSRVWYGERVKNKRPALFRGRHFQDAIIARWVLRCAPILSQRIRREMRRPNRSWRVDETYVRVAGRWTYLYRAVDSQGNTIDFMLSPHQ